MVKSSIFNNGCFMDDMGPFVWYAQPASDESLLKLDDGIQVHWSQLSFPLFFDMAVCNAILGFIKILSLRTFTVFII